MTRGEYSKKYRIKEWKVSCIIALIFSKVPFSDIAKQYEVSTRRIVSINAILVNNYPEKNYRMPVSLFEFAYWENESEMKMQKYKVEDLEGEELLIKNKIVTENLSFGLY